MKKIFNIFFICITLLCLGCNDAFDCIKGEGPVVTRTLTVASFTSLELHGSHKVFISHGQQQEVQVKGQDNIINRLNLSVNNGHWNLKLNECTRNHEELVFYVTVPTITSLSVAGSGDIVGQTLLEAGDMHLKIAGSGSINTKIIANTLYSDISGSGKIEVTGACEQADLKISGSGKYLSSDMAVNKFKIDIAGSGNATVYILDQLDVDIAGSGTVRYFGNPYISTNISGSGKVIKED
ncbi:MAG: DUF2807 domain-containing protein [Bacteroidota bacterium]|nr:DUF2807 domain-containing protein [Bacteroidota bacterium]